MLSAHRYCVISWDFTEKGWYSTWRRDHPLTGGIQIPKREQPAKQLCSLKKPVPQSSAISAALKALLRPTSEMYLLVHITSGILIN